MNGKPNVWARRKARRALVQAVYQWQVSGNDISSVIEDFAEGDSLKKADNEFFNEVFRKTTSAAGELDDVFGELLDREIDKLDFVEHAIDIFVGVRWVSLPSLTRLLLS